MQTRMFTTLLASTLLMGCSTSQQLQLDLPEGYQVTGSAEYHHDQSRGCRTGFSLGSGSWMYQPPEHLSLTVRSADGDEPLRIKLPTNKGVLCRQELDSAYIVMTPPGPNPEPISATIHWRSNAEPLALAYSCERMRSLTKGEIIDETHCWPNGQRGMHKAMQLAGGEAPFGQPVVLKVSLAPEIGMLGQWVQLGNALIPYRLTPRGNDLSAIELLSFRAKGHDCTSLPSCDTDFDQAQARQRAFVLEQLLCWLWLEHGDAMMVMYGETSISDWINRQLHDAERYQWQTLEQVRFLLAARLPSSQRDDPAWEPRPGEDAQSHYQRCLTYFSQPRT